MPFFDPASRLEDILAAIRDIETFSSGKSFDDYMVDVVARVAGELVRTLLARSRALQALV